MHSLHRLLHKRAGFSLVEILIVIALTAILSVVGYQQIGAISRNRASLNAQRDATARLQKLVNEVRKDFRSRSEAPQFVATTTFMGGTTPCQGLRLFHQDTTANVKVGTLYTTECAPFEVKNGADWVSLINADPSKFPLNKDLNCGPHDLPRVVITETRYTMPLTTSTRYIAEQPSATFPASEICFRQKGPDIQVEAGGLSGAGKEVLQKFQRTSLSTRDKSGGIEYVSP